MVKKYGQKEVYYETSVEKMMGNHTHIENKQKEVNKVINMPK